MILFGPLNVKNKTQDVWSEVHDPKIQFTMI